MDMYEDDGELYIEVELPSVSPGDVEVLADGQDLVIRAPVASPPPPVNSLVTERRRGTYERRVPLEHAWDTTKTRAEFQDGLLTLRLPRLPRMEGTKRIRLEQGKAASRPTPGVGEPKDKAAPGAESEKPAPGNGTAGAPGPLLIGGPISESKS